MGAVIRRETEEVTEELAAILQGRHPAAAWGSRRDRATAFLKRIRRTLGVSDSAVLAVDIAENMEEIVVFTGVSRTTMRLAAQILAGKDTWL